MPKNNTSNAVKRLYQWVDPSSIMILPWTSWTTIRVTASCGEECITDGRWKFCHSKRTFLDIIRCRNKSDGPNIPVLRVVDHFTFEQHFRCVICKTKTKKIDVGKLILCTTKETRMFGKHLENALSLFQLIIGKDDTLPMRGANVFC